MIFISYAERRERNNLGVPPPKRVVNGRGFQDFMRRKKQKLLNSPTTQLRILSLILSLAIRRVLKQNRIRRFLWERITERKLITLADVVSDDGETLFNQRR